MFGHQSFNAQLDIYEYSINERKNLQFECVKLPKLRSRISPEPNNYFPCFLLAVTIDRTMPILQFRSMWFYLLNALIMAFKYLCQNASSHSQCSTCSSETQGKPFNELGQLLAVQSFSHRGTNDVHRASKHVP